VLAPRALGNCAPSAPMAGASVRPLSFTVREQHNLPLRLNVVWTASAGVMSTSVRAKYILTLSAWLLGFVFLAYALISLPLLHPTPRVWTALALGLIPLSFFDNNYRQRYLCFCILMAGVCGVLGLGGNYANCLIGASMCPTAEDQSRLIIAASTYLLFGTLGGIWLRRITRSASPER